MKTCGRYHGDQQRIRAFSDQIFAIINFCQIRGFSAKGDLHSRQAEAVKCEKAKTFDVRCGEDIWKVSGRSAML